MSGAIDRRQSHNVRKLVTILFSDIVDSSRLSLALDPETLQTLLARYFGEMNAVIDRHGGVIENITGDGIMAVFGVPTLHEDDALRSVRSAIDMRDALSRLNHEFQAGWGVTLAHRIGINTGEVITGADSRGQRFLTGEAVRVAKRIEEAATPDEVLIGESTYKLVRASVVAKPSGPRALKHSEMIRPFIVIGLSADVTRFQRRFETPLVGRATQLREIHSVFNSVSQHRYCHQLNIMGEAGVGKSRLVSEVLNQLPGAMTVAHGRCRPYGEGVTYQPLADIVREITGAEGLDLGRRSVAKIAESLSADERAGQIAERVSELLGFGANNPGRGEESFWAVRRVLEALAKDQPLVVVLDDLHWAAPTFLKLIEHIVEFSRGFPILIMCLSRPELLEMYPSWGSPRFNTSNVWLEPLNEAECHELLANLLNRFPVPPIIQSTIVRAADGNPLFAEEFVAALIEEELLVLSEHCWIAQGDLSQPRTPLTIEALLGARLDRLPKQESAVLATAAIEGGVFHRSAIIALSESMSESTVDESLTALVQRDLIRPHAPVYSGEDAYQFRHILIREAAYRSLSKHSRASLHEQFADWLEKRASDQLKEFDEIVGFHFEQAFQYRLGLDSRDPVAASLGESASTRLEAAARRALARSNLSAAISLLERLCVSVPHLIPRDDPRRRLLLAELGRALIESGRLDEAEHTLNSAMQLASGATDERALSHILVEQSFLRLLRAEEGAIEETKLASAHAIPTFVRHGDDLGLCRAWRLEALRHWNEARAEEASGAWKRAAIHARLAGDQHGCNEILAWIASSLWFGPTPARNGVRRCKKLLKRVHNSPESEAAILRHLGGLYGMLGQFDTARRFFATSNEAYAELGFKLDAAMSHNEAVVELLAGNPAAAERNLRAGYDALEAMGERMFRSTTAAFLARAVLEQGREGEAEEWAQDSAQLAAKGDLLTQMLWRGVHARVLAGRSQFSEAETVARDAVKLAQVTDFTNHRADALLDLAVVLKASGRHEEASTFASEARCLYKLKGNNVSALAIQDWLISVANTVCI